MIALTGGYRRAPMMQIGSDIYCDTALIAEVLERIQPEPTLYPQTHVASGRILAAWADQYWFAAGVGYAMQPEGFNSMFATYSAEHRAAFVEDRKAFRKGSANGFCTQRPPCSRNVSGNSSGRSSTDDRSCSAPKQRLRIFRSTIPSGLFSVQLPSPGSCLRGRA